MNLQSMLVGECEPRPFLDGAGIELMEATTEHITHHLNWNAIFSYGITNRRIS
jgi:hypothetical protein